MAFTCGHGDGTVNCCTEQLSVKFVNKKLKYLVVDMRATHQICTGDSQWIGPEKGVIQLATEHEVDVRVHGYPSYTTFAGWLVRRLIREFQAEGFTYFKQKVGSDRQADIRRAGIIARKLVMRLLPFKSIFIEEPTSSDNMLGHAAIPKALYPRTKVVTGEHIQNRIIFKQLFQAQVIDFCQINSCRVAGVNEVLAILLMVKKLNIPVALMLAVSWNMLIIYMNTLGSCCYEEQQIHCSSCCWLLYPNEA
ncbi:enolase C-terminal domain-like protein [Thamnidium elegans]|nr:enolase C-terminal domain-like protein [Thamnidium elegans]